MRKAYIMLFTAVLGLTFSSCEKALFDDIEEPANQGKPCNLSIRTRAASGTTVTYPIHVFAFNQSDNKLAAQQTITSAEDVLALTLNKGNYHISAWTGLDTTTPNTTLDLEADLTKDTAFGLQGNASVTPLMMGQSDITLNSENTSASLTLRYAVAKVDIILKELPTGTASVSAALSPLYSTTTLDGNPAGTATATVSLTQSGTEAGTWQSATTYMLPTNGAGTTISITITDSEGNTTVLGHSLPTKLEAGTPYELVGTYDSNTATLTGTFQALDWEDKQTITFDFGTDVPDTPVTPTPDGPGTTTADALPEACSLWNEHVVALIDEDKNTFLLISHQEWQDVASAKSATDPDMAENIAATYKEDDITGWRIPTKEEAALLVDTYGSEALNLLNALFDDNNQITIEDGSKDVRYLCEDGNYSFMFKNEGTTISVCGVKKTYNLRLVKTITVE